MMLWLVVVGLPAAAAEGPVPTVLPTLTPTFCFEGAEFVTDLPDVTDSTQSNYDDRYVKPWAEVLFEGIVASATLTCTWKDQGWGYRKGTVAMYQRDSLGNIIGGQVVGPALHSWSALTMTVTYVPQWQPNWRHVLSLYGVGGGGGHVLYIKDASVKITCGTHTPTTQLAASDCGYAWPGTPIIQDGSFYKLSDVPKIVNYALSFTLTIDVSAAFGHCACGILHVGGANMWRGERYPLIYFGNNGRLYVSQSYRAPTWKGDVPDFSIETSTIFQAGQTYDIVVENVNSRLTISVNGVLESSVQGSATYAPDQAGVLWAGSTHYMPLKANITNLHFINLDLGASCPPSPAPTSAPTPAPTLRPTHEDEDDLNVVALVASLCVVGAFLVVCVILYEFAKKYAARSAKVAATTGATAVPKNAATDDGDTITVEAPPGKLNLEFEGTSAIVKEVLFDSPLVGKVYPGDVLKSVNGVAVTGGKCLTNAVAAADDGTNPRALLFLRKRQPALATLVRMGTVEAVHAAEAFATDQVQATLAPLATVISVQGP